MLTQLQGQGTGPGTEDTGVYGEVCGPKCQACDTTFPDSVLTEPECRARAAAEGGTYESAHEWANFPGGCFRYHGGTASAPASNDGHYYYNKLAVPLTERQTHEGGIMNCARASELEVTKGSLGHPTSYSICVCNELPSPPPVAPSPSPPPIDCDTLAPDGNPCGATVGVCRNCCSSTGYCGSTALHCGGGNQATYSYSVLDPEGTECPLPPGTPPGTPPAPPEPQNSLAAAPAAPSATLRNACEAELYRELKELSTVSCSGGAQQQALDQLTLLAPTCGEDGGCAASNPDTTGAAVLRLLPSLATLLASSCGEDGGCTADKDADAWAETIVEAMPRMLSKLCPCLPPAPADGEPCDLQCENEQDIRRYCESTCDE